MPIINKVPNKKITINLQGSISIPSTDANILLIGHRSGVISGAVPDYFQLKPKQNYPLLTAYRAYDLPSFSSGDEAINYMRALGFTAYYGLSNNLLFPAPSMVITPSSELKNKYKKQVVVDSIVTLQWDSPPKDFDLLIGSGKEITLSQTNTTEDAASIATGTVASVNLDPCQLVLTNVQGTFTNSAQINISYIDTNANVPDPKRSDEICMMVYSAVNSTNNKFPQTLNTITPTLSITFLNPQDTGFSPNPTPVKYLATDGSDAVISAVQTLANGNLGSCNCAIYFATEPANFGITPITELGITAISKDKDNYGTLVRILPGITSSGVGIELKDVTGSFAVGDVVNIILDAAKDVFSLLTKPQQYPVSPYEVTSQADINNPTSKFVPLFNYLNKANAPTSVNTSSYFAMGIVANISTPKQQAGNLPVFDTPNGSTVGAQYISGAYYPYIMKLGDYPLSAAIVASQYAGIIACNDVPFNPVNGVTLKLPVIADLTTALNDSSSINTTINLGWTPIAVNSKLLAYIVRAVTGLLYLPATPTPDTEYFPVTDWQILGLWKKAVFQVLNQPQFTNKRKSIQLTNNIVNALQPLGLNFENRGMFYNMSKLIGEFTVADDADDAAKYNVITPVCVTPEFNAIDVTVNVVSYLSETTTTA